VGKHETVAVVPSDCVSRDDDSTCGWTSQKWPAHAQLRAVAPASMLSHVVAPHVVRCDVVVHHQPSS